MNKLNKMLILGITIINLVNVCAATKEKTLNSVKLISPNESAHISPEILNELKDFQNLIPEATVDEIAAKHIFVDRSFRSALKYLRSQEFTQLQRELLNIPEIINVLEFLHLTSENATITHMDATEKPAIGGVMPSLDEYYNYNSILQSKTDAIENAEEVLDNLKVPKRPQQHNYMKEDNNKYDTHSTGNGVDDDDEGDTVYTNFVEYYNRQPLVRILLLEVTEAKKKFYHHRQHHHRSLGTLTTFVAEVLQHLPHTAYQNLIEDKCRKNAKFAKFYQALRSADFKPLIEQVKSTENIKNTIKTLKAHKVDVDSLEPIAFKVISWGPNI